jgi:hypothetical protein
MILAMRRGLLISVLFVSLVSFRAASTPPIPTKPEAKRIPGQIVGTPSCSARACHGGDEPLLDRLIGRHEYSAWNYADPHTRSLQVLHNELSENIRKRLHMPKPAYEEPRCLACHAETVGGDGPAHLSAIGCESCHGPAWLWLDPHTAGKDWRTRYPEASKDLLDVNNLVAVARSCVGCHVGSPPENGIGVRDMNHDMIAAGHPRLNFEFAGYLAQLPSHWNEKARPRDAQFYAKAWAVGQAVSADGALNLLEYRATNGVWPELAEYACYACHHDLAGPAGWRRDSKGTLPWGSWYFAALSELSPDSRDPIRRFAESLSQRPAGPKVVEEIKAIRPLINGVMKGFDTPFASADLRSRASGELLEPARRDWDGAAQLYLALSALSPDADRAKLTEFWKELRDPRAFSTKRDQYLKQLEDLLKNSGTAPP